MTNDIRGERGGRIREVEEREVDIGVPLFGDQLYAWDSTIELFTLG